MVAIAQARNPETNVFDRVALVVTRYVCVCVGVFVCVLCVLCYSGALELSLFFVVVYPGFEF